MDNIIELPDELKSKVEIVYRMYKRGKWYQSDTPEAGYSKYYYATKVRIRLYYKDEESAQRDADAYNKRRAAYEKGKLPQILTWSMFQGTELQNNQIWWHDSGSWLYAHGYDDWSLSELLRDDMFYVYDDYNHTTADFFDILTTLPKFSDYALVQNKNGEYKLQKRR